MRPETIREPSPAGGQVERDGLAGDQVVGREGRELGAAIRASQVRRGAPQRLGWPGGPRRLRASRTPPSGSGSRRSCGSAGSAGPRATSSSSATSRSPPTSPWCAPRRPDPALVGHLSSLLARARNRAVGTRTGAWRGVAGFFTAPLPGGAVPPALVVAGHAGGQRRRDRGHDALAAGAPQRGAEPALARPRSTSWSTRTSRATTASTPPAHFAAQVWVNNAWVAALCLALGVLGAPGALRAVQQRRQPRDHRLDHEPQRPRRSTSGA